MFCSCGKIVLIAREQLPSIIDRKDTRNIPLVNVIIDQPAAQQNGCLASVPIAEVEQETVVGPMVLDSAFVDLLLVGIPEHAAPNPGMATRAVCDLRGDLRF